MRAEISRAKFNSICPLNDAKWRFWNVKDKRRFRDVQAENKQILFPIKLSKRAVLARNSSTFL